MKKLTTLALIFSAFSLFSQKTLVDAKGNRMRGYPVVISKHYYNTEATGKWWESESNWKMLKDSSLNTVRVCWIDPYFEDNGWTHWKATDPELLLQFDKCVNNAQKFGMNVIINYHNVGEQSQQFKDLPTNANMKRVADFWNLIAPRYKDKDWVYYEITNEPTFNGNLYLTEPFKTNLTNIYKAVRAAAPQRQILMFSFNSLYHDYPTIVNSYAKDMDWDFTSVAYHAYGKGQSGTEDNPSTNAVTISKNYRVICTEWDYHLLYPKTQNYFYMGKMDGYDVNGQALEKLGHSWIDWHNWLDYSMKGIFGYFYPHAKKNGYFWGANAPKILAQENGNLASKSVFAYPNPVKNTLKIKNDKKESIHFQIVGLNGKLLQLGKIENNEIDVAQYAEGIYILNLYDKNFKKKETLRFVK